MRAAWSLNLSVLQVMCERALASMEESHSRTVGELQCRHQREVERLLLERERLLEEESAATATGEERRLPGGADGSAHICTGF